jgi:hypothetical protein
MVPTILRAVERILGVVIGGVAIYLGYRLFLNLPEKTDSSGKVILPGGTSIFLSRVGPGAFFALFGAIVVAISFHKAVSVETSSEAASTNKSLAMTKDVTLTRYQGATGNFAAPDDPKLLNRRGDVRGVIAMLNRMTAAIPAADSVRAQDYGNAVRDSKLALLHEVWAEDWGSFDEFREWVVERGEAAPAPKQAKEPRELFHHGETTGTKSL